MNETWFVVTPEYETVEDYIEGHAIFGRGADWVDVQAATRREAISLAVGEWLGQHNSYCATRKRDGLNPFRGVVARREADVKAEEQRMPPPGVPDDCWFCVPPHDGATRWCWKDDDVEWGWFGACDKAEHMTPKAGLL